MKDSILTSIKKTLDIDPSNSDFDDVLVLHINTVLMTLRQIGIGPADGFSIEDASSTWSDMLNENELRRLQLVKTYVSLKVRKIFDPPTSGIHMNSLNELIKEYEFRLNIEER